MRPRRGAALTILGTQITFWRVLGWFVLVSLFFNEFLSLELQHWRWSSLASDPESEQLRVLFVADPQLQGFEDEPTWIGWLTRWDADRYLRNTFRKAFHHHHPDVIVYLGDLLDEGSKARDEHYKIYVDRFKDIFRQDVEHVYLSGDNDVGGEGMFDLKEEWKMKRFNSHFPDQGATNVDFVSFLRLHFDYGQLINADYEKELEHLFKKSSGAKIRILINHMTVMDRNRKDMNHLLRNLKPSIIITAHTHVAKLKTCVDCIEKLQEDGIDSRQRWLGGTSKMESYQVYKFALNDGVTIHELVVPTCSYRMGVPEMGYGAAVFSPTSMEYTLLWLPSRYHQLYGYGTLLIFCVLALFVKFVLCRRSR